MSSSRTAWIELLCTVVVPTLVLVLGTDVFGPVGVLLVGLAAPAGWSVYLVWREGRASPMAMLSMLGVGASGAIGLLQLETRWFAWKEASLGLLVGSAVVASAFSRWPVVGVLLDGLLVQERLNAGLDRAAAHAAYASAVRSATVQLGVVSLLAAVAQGYLAHRMVTSAAGTEDFAAELGWYTGWSFPMVTIPSVVVAVVILRRVLARVEALVGEPWDDLLPPLEG